MNKEHLKKSVGFHVQLRPPPLDRNGQPVDSDWIIRSVDEASIRVEMVGYGYTAALGYDQVYSFMSNPDRDRGGTRHGFLQLFVQLTAWGNEGLIEPIPPPKAPADDAVTRAGQFDPLVIEFSGVRRCFSWRGR